jgi:glucokinase
VVRVGNLGHTAFHHRDVFAHEHEIEFFAGTAAWVGRQARAVDAAEPSRRRKEIEFPGAVKRVEIAGDDDRFTSRLEERVKIAELDLAVTVFERKMNEKNAAQAEVELDDQPLDALVEVVVTGGGVSVPNHERVGLLSRDRDALSDRGGRVLAFVVRFVPPEAFGNRKGLVHGTRPHRSRIHFDERHDVRAVFTEKTHDARERRDGRSRHEREVRPRTHAVTNVVEDETEGGHGRGGRAHRAYCTPRRRRLRSGIGRRIRSPLSKDGGRDVRTPVPPHPSVSGLDCFGSTASPETYVPHAPDSSRTTVLSGDVGGTKALLELALLTSGGVQCLRRAERASGDYDSLEALVRSFLEEASEATPPRIAVFSVAAPIVHGRGRFTNLPWQLDEESLARTLGIERAVFLNDFVAACYGIDGLGPNDLLTLSPGRPDVRAPRLVLGAGTGLGQGFVVPGPEGPLAFPSEGGHSGFAPRDAGDHALHRYLLERYGERISQERVLSGMGLALLDAFLKGGGEEPLAPEIVTKRAGEGDIRSLEAIRLFLALYGSYAGDAALHFLPHGGLYVAGGLVTHLRPWIGEGAFLEAFRNKGRMRGLLESVPVHVVLNPALELLGAQRHALRTLRYRAS